MKDCIKKILTATWYCAVINFAIFSFICIYIGGRAMTGKIKVPTSRQIAKSKVPLKTKYYIHGAHEYEEVSKNVYYFSYYYELVMYALGFMGLACAIIVASKEGNGLLWKKDKYQFGFLKDYYFSGQDIRGIIISGLVNADSMEDATDILNENEITPEKIKVASKRERELYSDNYIKRKIPKVYAVEIPDDDSEKESENIK